MRSLLAILLLAVGALAWAQETTTPPATPPPPKPVSIEGTCVEMVPPEGYEKATAFSGFINRGLSASLRVTVYQYGTATHLGNFTKDKLAARGETLNTTQPATFNGVEGTTFITTMTANNQKYGKLYAIFGDQTQTIEVMATMSEASAKQAGAWDTLSASVMSARLSTDIFAGKPYALKMVEPIKYAMKVGDGVMFTSVENAADITQTLYLFAAKRDNETPYETAELAKLLLAKSRAISDGAVLEEKAVTINGMPGIQLFGAATYKGTEKKCLFVLTVLKAELNRYFLIQGYAPATPGAEDRIRDEDRAKAEVLRKMTDTLKRKKA